MAVADENGLVMLWTKIQSLKWHQWARIVALMVLLDQMLGPISNLPSDATIIVVALGALFAPVPAERDKH